jgi:hypothetical protein
MRRAVSKSLLSCGGRIVRGGDPARGRALDASNPLLNHCQDGDSVDPQFRGG